MALPFLLGLVTLLDGLGKGVGVESLVLTKEEEGMLLDSNVFVVLGFIEHSSRPGVLLEGGVCGSSRAWVYQSKGIGMKG